VKAETAPHGLTFSRKDLLRWLYLGRLAVVSGVLAGALARWLVAEPRDTRVATGVFILGLAASAASWWYTHLLDREPSENFLYGQLILDVILATAIVGVTGGDDSTFAPLYILVIAEGALLLPLAGGVLISGLASILYFAVIVWRFQGTLTPAVGYQILLFVVVAFATGILGDRLRRAGLALGTVTSELRQLRLDTGDILANVSTGVLTVDGSGRLAYLNPAGEELLDLKASHWLGAPVVSTVERIAPGMGKVLLRSIQESLPISRFKTRARRRGEEITLGVSTAVLRREGGGLPSATALFQDITELERIDVLDRRAERLEAVAELSASLAHEIKNPLASIRSAVEQLSAGALAQDDRKVLEKLVLSESDRLSRLLSEFLEFSGMTTVSPEPMDLTELVRGCVALVRQHPDCGMDPNRIVCRGLEHPVVIPADQDLLHRAVFNILLNAVQFSGPEGSVHVILDGSPAGVPGEVTRLEAPVRLAIQDSGPGVDPADLERIFDPFYTTRRRGSGLGLAVVHRAVEAHNGTVVVDRSPQGGAEFVIYLPGIPGTSAERAS
jgi:two-component system sensor histidine kinase PilS (NtrC family)